MKKSNAKSAKSPAPATNSAKSAKKKAPSKSAPVKAVAASAPAVAARPAPAPVAPAAPAPATPATPPTVKPIASTPVQTRIVAQIDIGFGNALYVRGDGAGLSWQEGLPMQCVAADRWELTLGEASRPIAFKLLLNDNTWCTGPDSTVASGETITVTPEFC